MRNLIVIALVSVLAFAGCYRRFTNDLAFHAPGGWAYSPVPGGGEVWTKVGDSHEGIMAQATDTPLSRRSPDGRTSRFAGTIRRYL